MAITLYDISVPNYLQILGAASGFLARGREHFEANQLSLDELVETRIFDDMLPLRFQVVSTAHHSLGTTRAMASGEFAPPSSMPHLDYQGLEDLIKEAQAEIQALTPDAVNAHEGGEILFKIGGNSLAFTTEDFVSSFSMPNFYFHATTTYDILRSKGVPIGKRDFIGKMRMKG
ncbi:MAG: DUF1993 domain-containing protein [Proteobacteria bacterium]|jgi:uncharacterized protein|nr:DUF1993 domain-containing protein [Pseudomonadota bacterium]MDA1300106.1 DUF1993 domain-containing protein [Pseudomonadota bacterium]